MNRSASRSLLALAALVALLLTACGTGPAEDPYADPDVAPPPPIEDPTVTTSGSVSAREDSDLVDINVAGFLAPEDEAGALRTAQAIPELTEDDFTVVEAGDVQGITVERIGGERTAAADVVFVFDTTGSMGAALDSVRDSVIGYANHLAASGLDVRFGAVTFGDAYDTLDSERPAPGTSLGDYASPTFDANERATLPFTSSMTEFEEFITYEADVAGPRAGGDSLENALGALEFAYDEFDWRAGAQRSLIVITDVCSHDADTYTAASITDPWIPGTFEDVLGKIRGSATVHAVSPADAASSYACGDGTDMADFTGAEGTGGVHVEWDGSEFDLTELPLASAAGGYIVTFRGEKDGEPKEIRVVIDDGSDVRGEFTLTASY